MPGQSPRDFAGWMREVERLRVSLRGLAGAISTGMDVVRQEVAEANNLQPTAPVELSAETAVYLDRDHTPRARLSLDFPDVTKSTNGKDLEVSSYELWGQDITGSLLAGTTDAVPGLAYPGLTLPGLAATPDNVSLEAGSVQLATLVDTSAMSSFRTDGFTPGTVWEFRVRAIGRTTIIPGVYSEPVQVQMLVDETPPPQPTAPILTVSRGTITVRWDGMAVTGAMPADFQYASLAHGDGSSPTTEIARFGRGGGFTVVADIDYYDPQFFRLQAVDESGNLGPWSEQAVGYTSPLVDRDVILSTIDGAKTYLKNIDARVSILDGTILTEHLVVTEEMTAAIANFLYIKSDKIDVNSLAADEIFTGLLDGVLVRADMFQGKAFEGGVFTTSYGGKFQTDVEDLVGVKLTAKGLDAWSDSGVHTLSFDTATGNLNIYGGTLTGSVVQSSALANNGWKLQSDGLRIWNTGGQLALAALTTGATFTGTVKSGFGTTSAAITDNAGRGRPGLQLPTSTTDYWYPSVVGASGLDGYGQGTLLAHSGRTDAGSWYSILSLTKGDFFLGNQNNDGSSTVSIASVGGATKVTGGSGVLQAGSGASYLSVPGAVMQVESSGAATIAAGGTTIYGGLNVSGSKNFVMDHPTKPGMELLHGATESPVSGVQYWGCAEVGADGSALVRLPEYFDALVKPGTACIGVNGNGAVVDWDAEVIDNSFAVRGPAGTAFTWDVKAERMGADFPVEREKVMWTPPDGVAE